MERSSSNQASTVGGIVLVGLGILFLVQQALGLDIGHFGWPLFILLPGMAFLAAFALSGPGGSGMAVPGCVLITLGLMLAVQNTFNVWQTWAYAWALIPASVGLGLRLQGERQGKLRLVHTGTRMLEWFLLAFVVFAALFELIIDLSHFGLGPLKGMLGPAVLILAGIYLLLRRRTNISTEP